MLLKGGIYKDQKLDPSHINSNLSLLAWNASKPVKSKEKKLIVIQIFISLRTCTCIMREMKDANRYYCCE